MRRYTIPLTVALALSLGGCGAGKTMSDLVSKVKAYDTTAKLEETLGKPDRIAPGEDMKIMGQVYVYQATDGEVQFGIVLGRVVGSRQVAKQEGQP